MAGEQHVSGYLMQWFDPELPIREGESEAEIENAERERLGKLAAVAAIALTVPRRLGSDASAEELARDKRRCRRIAHAATMSALAWGDRKTATVSNREGAQVDWERWWPEHQTYLRNRIRYIATWAMKTSGHERWAKSAIVRLNNELSWLEYAMR